MDTPLKPGDDYTCAECGGVFAATRPHEEAVAEAEELFGDILKYAPTVIVCDDCWNELMEEHPA